MPVNVENKMKHCSCCGQRSLHHRNVNKMSGGWIFVNLVLIVLTAGLWLIPLIPISLYYTVTNPIIGGWICSKCGK